MRLLLPLLLEGSLAIFPLVATDATVPAPSLAPWSSLRCQLDDLLLLLAVITMAFDSAASWLPSPLLTTG
jgi:hypothetical protein